MWTWVRETTGHQQTEVLQGVCQISQGQSSLFQKSNLFHFQVNIEGEELSCAHMKSFNKEGAGSLYIYWDREWTKEYECQLVKYQTPFNALKPGDYVRCVEDQFKVKLA